MQVVYLVFKIRPASLMNISTVLALSVAVLLTACGGGGGTTTLPPPVTFTVGGTLNGLASGNSITLTDNGSDSLTLKDNGAFKFATQLQSGSSYRLTVAGTTPTGQPCTSTFGAGTVDAANVTSINVFCGLPGGHGTYTTTGSFVTARDSHTTTLLSDGTVLAAGGFGIGFGDYLASAELYSPSTGDWTSTGAMTQERAYHTATLLPNGNVLVSGGVVPSGGQTVLAASELYDPSTGSWTATGSLNTGRWGHTMTLLPNGEVLVAGGAGQSEDLSSTELYDPSTGRWTTTGSLNTARYFHTATLLPNGKVLVAGGMTGVYSSAATYSESIASAELYDPSTGLWTVTGSLNTARDTHTSTLLPNGDVLVSGGEDYTVSVPGYAVNDVVLASAERYDPSTGNWTGTGSLATERIGHTAVLLPSGNVLVSGGGSGGTILASSELYNPDSGAWSLTGSMVLGRATHNATLLTNGKVLITGGGTSISAIATTSELYF